MMIDNFKDNIIDRDIFEQAVKIDSHFDGRWGYYEEIITQLKKFEDVHSVLEFGPHKLPFVKGSDVIDICDLFIKQSPIEIGTFIAHDCGKFPLPVEDNSYDLVIACQVIEHFGIYGQQVEFFNELERICKKAIISLPYKWFRPQIRNHHMIDEHMIKYWTGNRKPTFELISGDSYSSRILQIYDFENGSSISDVEEEHKFFGYVKESQIIDSRLEKLKEINEKLNQKNERLMQNNKKLHDEVSELTQSNKSLIQTNKKLKKNNSSLNKELDLIKSSNSWKLTSPVRNLKSKFK